MMNILGLDYGEKRVGVALAQTPIAEPVGIINNDARLIEEIKKLVQQYQIGLLVVGVSENVMAQKSREWGQRLKDAGFKVEFQDETLSSHEASENLRHKTRSFRSKPQDAYQAAVMLQDWLDSKNNLLAGSDP